MRYLKKYRLFESVNEEEIHDICREYGITSYTINEDGTIDVDGDVNLTSKLLTKLPLKFRNVGGGFCCSSNQLTTLSGAPQTVGGDFRCSYNQLKTLEGAPQLVGGNFSCYDNQLTTLEGAPKSVGDGFYCSNNQLTNLEGLEFKSFKKIYLERNPVYLVVKNWINKGNREDLIEYFVDMNIIQDNKLIMVRLEAFYEDMDLEMDIDFNKVKKYYKIIE